MAARPSLLRQWQARFKSTVTAYNRAKELFDEIDSKRHDYSDEEWQKARDRERMLRGVVRGGAQMLIILSRPWEWKNNEAILDMEIDYGMPGKRSKPRPGVSPLISQYFEDNR